MMKIDGTGLDGSPGGGLWRIPLCQYGDVGPPLDELLFPVHRVVKKSASRSVRIFLFFFILTRMYRYFFLRKKTFFSKNMGRKKSSSRPF